MQRACAAWRTWRATRGWRTVSWMYGEGTCVRGWGPPVSLTAVRPQHSSCGVCVLVFCICRAGLCLMVLPDGQEHWSCQAIPLDLCHAGTGILPEDKVQCMFMSSSLHTTINFAYHFWM